MLSFSELFGLHEKRRLEEVEPKTIANEISDTRKLLRLRGLDVGSDSEWLASFEEFQSAIDAAKKDISSEQARRTFSSNINQLRKTVRLQLENRSPVNNLWDAYLAAFQNAINRGNPQQLMTKNEFIMRCFSATGISRRRLNAESIMVQQVTWDRIQALETELGAPGELTKFLINISPPKVQQYKTEFSKRLSAALAFEYRHPHDEWSPSLKDEWSQLEFFKTRPADAKIKWRLDGFDPKNAYRWRVRSKDKSNRSAMKQQYELELFFGWCLKPMVFLSDGKLNLWRSGAGLREDELSLSLVCNLDLVMSYIGFRRAHTITEAESIKGDLGNFNHACTLFCQMAGSLLNVESGFIFFRPDLYFRPQIPEENLAGKPQNIADMVSDKFYNPLTRKREVVADADERWFRFCNETRSAITAAQKDAVPSGETVKTRDPNDPIRHILDLPHPRAALIELCYELEKHEPIMPYWKWFHLRIRVFFELICRCPLRVSMFGLMTGQNLKKLNMPDPSGFGQNHYQIQFAKADFKNERFLNEDFKFDLPASLNKLIDTFLLRGWSALHGRPFEENSRVFQTRSEDDADTDLADITDNIVAQLNKTCKRMTARYLGEKYKSPGFYAHAIRHIIATDVIKSTGNFHEAALLLWDSLDTVRKEYAHILKTEELAKTSARLESDFVIYRNGKTA